MNNNTNPLQTPNHFSVCLGRKQSCSVQVEITRTLKTQSYTAPGHPAVRLPHTTARLFIPSPRSFYSLVVRKTSLCVLWVKIMIQHRKKTKKQTMVYCAAILGHDAKMKLLTSIQSRFTFQLIQ